MKIEDEIREDPELIGSYAKAWQVDLASARRVVGAQPDADATVAYWIVEAPDVHVAWHSYSLVLINLQRRFDIRATKLYLKNATHELWLYAMNPDVDRNRILVSGGPGWLTPCNFAAQFAEPSDEAAAKRVADAVREICAGTLSPDTDFRALWIERFGDNMMKPGRSVSPVGER